MRLILLLVVGYILLRETPVSEIAGVTGSSIPFSALASAIQLEEGYYPGSRAYRNQNPGNLRYAGQYGSTGADDAGFAVFPDYHTGFDALINQLQLDASRHPDWTVMDFVSHYAPSSDNNVPGQYARNISTYLNGIGYQVDPNSTTLGQFA